MHNLTKTITNSSDVHLVKITYVQSLDGWQGLESLNTLSRLLYLEHFAQPGDDNHNAEVDDDNVDDGSFIFCLLWLLI